jgi:hypothetical protein
MKKRNTNNIAPDQHSGEFHGWLGFVLTKVHGKSKKGQLSSWQTIPGRLFSV